MFTKFINQKLKKPFKGTWWGDFLSKLKGEGLEVEDIRLYQPWDEVKSINWKLTAKTGKIYINIFRTTKDVDFHIFLDININWFEKWRNDKKIYQTILEEISYIYRWFRQKKANIRLFRVENDKIRAFKVSRLWELIRPFYTVKVKRRYQSWLSSFLIYQAKIKKRRVILIISDLLSLDKKEVQIIKGLSKTNEIFIHSILDFESIWFWTNFDYLSFASNPYINELKDFLI